MQVFYTCLPKVFDQSEDFIGSIDYLPLSNNECRIEMKNKHYKLIQEAKRAWLSVYLCMYEHQIQIQRQQHEYIYKQIEIQLLTVTANDPTTLFNTIDEYLIYRLNQLKQEFSNQTYSIKCKILRNHR